MKWLPIPDLAPEEEAQLRQLVEAFLAQRGAWAAKRPTLAWWGGAQALREQYTSVELQHLASEWRIRDTRKTDFDRTARGRKEPQEVVGSNP